LAGSENNHNTRRKNDEIYFTLGLSVMFSSDTLSGLRVFK